MKKTLCILSALLLFLLPCGCVKSQGTITVNEVTHSIFYAPFYAAINLGYFKQQGIEIELVNGGGSDKSMTALLAKQADIALLGPETAVYVANQGKEDSPVIFAQLTRKDGSFLLGKQKDDGFTWEKLRGKSIIGGRKGGMPQMMLEYAMQKNNILPGKDATVRTDVSFDLMGGAFIGGQDDYVALFEPAASTVELAGQGYIVASVGQESGDVPYTCFMCLKSVLSGKPELIEQFLRALIKGQQFVEKSSASEIAEAVAPSFPDSDLKLITTVVERYKKIDVWSTTPALKQQDFERLISVIKQAGIITEAPEFTAVVDNTLAKRLAP